MSIWWCAKSLDSSYSCTSKQQKNTTTVVVAVVTTAANNKKFEPLNEELETNNTHSQQRWQNKNFISKSTEKVTEVLHFGIPTSLCTRTKALYFFFLWHPTSWRRRRHIALCSVRSLHIISNWICCYLKRNEMKQRKRIYIWKTRTHFYYTLNTLSIKNTTVNCLIYFHIFRVRDNIMFYEYTKTQWIWVRSIVCCISIALSRSLVVTISRFSNCSE